MSSAAPISVYNQWELEREESFGMSPHRVKNVTVPWESDMVAGGGKRKK
jgi:hypothetical protein